MNEQDIYGKKIFLLYFQSDIHEKILDMLIIGGYEAYTLCDHIKAQRLLAKFPGSFLFINIDKGLKEKEWETYIRSVLTNPATRDSCIGVLSYNTGREEMRNLFKVLPLVCGFIQLKAGLEDNARIIFKALEANHAKGRRKFIRAYCEDDVNAGMNYKAGVNTVYHGKLLDISLAGIAAKIEHFVEYPPNTPLEKVQIKLRGGLFLSDMTLMGKRHDNPSVYILLFDPKMPEANKMIIHRYIKWYLQKYIDGIEI